ncbi:EAF domain-containing protein [Mycena chlorophos]|uniref:EAF domain-containing protein n=1 Tax=Mycena chlorophos TaxID=658473 RepID=A0A8H6T782_MYCCL|nr:EAF domain-containing protein [Mycena chlorophos]
MPVEETSWIPEGTHNVLIGSSLNKALKARKGLPLAPPKRAGPPERDFFSFRYNFKPPALDPSKPGSLEVTRTKDKQDSGVVKLEHFSNSSPPDSIQFNGTETAAKEFDCVLIYDEDTREFKLEKLEACLNLSYAGTRATQSLPASTASTPILHNGNDMELDAEGELDVEEPTLPSQQYHHLREEKEEGSDEEGELPPLPPKPVAAKPAPGPTKATASTSTAPKPAAMPLQQRKTTKKAPLPPPPLPAEIDGDAYEEDLEFGRPSVKRRRKTPPPVQAPAALSLPSSSSSAWMAPPAPVVPAAAAAASDSEDPDSDWEPVSVPPPAPISAGVEVDLEMNDLEAQLEAELFDAEDDGGSDGEPEDFLAMAMPNSPSDPAKSSGVPLSMAQLAQLNGGGGYSDDDYSSSEDTDDD